MEPGYRACPYCAEPIREAATICRFCNRTLTNASIAAPPRASSNAGTVALKRKPRDWPYVVGFSAVGIIVVALLVFLLVRSNGQFGSAPASSPVRPTPPENRPSTAPAPATPRELSTGDIFREASPSVVLIEAFDDEGHKRVIGSGFLVASGGSILTNYHVIRGAYSAVARFAGGTRASILGVIGYDRERDVAVVAAASTSAPPLKLGSTSQLRAGDKLVAIGSPEGLENTVSEGIVSALRGGLIQMSTPISPGSSGGPVLDAHGEVVGIAVATVRGGENLNFAVPIGWARSYIGGSPSKSLVEVAQENTVVQSVFTGPISVPARGRQAWNIRINPNLMSSPELHGEFQSTGGADGLIRIAVTCNPGGVLYDSQRVRYGQLHVDLPPQGVCTLVIDNTPSVLFGRTVAGTIALRYVK